MIAKTVGIVGLILGISWIPMAMLFAYWTGDIFRTMVFTFVFMLATVYLLKLQDRLE